MVRAISIRLPTLLVKWVAGGNGRCSVIGEDTRHGIENDEVLRAWVLELAGRIWAARQSVMVPIPVNPKTGQCLPCGQRLKCRQACDNAPYRVSH
jgi:hypothetical protein